MRTKNFLFTKIKERMGSGQSVPTKYPRQTETLAKLLATPEAASCGYKDALEFHFRMVQIEIISNAILAIAKGLKTDKFNADVLQKNAMEYYNGQGVGPKDTYTEIKPYRDWRLLAEDNIFNVFTMTEEYNPFKEFEFLLDDVNPTTGRTNTNPMYSSPKLSNEDLKKVYGQFLVRFINIRKTLLAKMLTECEVGLGGGAPIDDATLTAKLKNNDDYTEFYDATSRYAVAIDKKMHLQDKVRKIEIMNHIIQSLAELITEKKYESGESKIPDLITEITTYKDELGNADIPIVDEGVVLDDLEKARTDFSYEWLLSDSTAMTTVPSLKHIAENLYFFYPGQPDFGTFKKPDRIIPKSTLDPKTEVTPAFALSFSEFVLARTELLLNLYKDLK